MFTHQGFVFFCLSVVICGSWIWASANFFQVQVMFLFLSILFYLSYSFHCKASYNLTIVFKNEYSFITIYFSPPFLLYCTIKPEFSDSRRFSFCLLLVFFFKLLYKLLYYLFSLVHKHSVFRYKTTLYLHSEVASCTGYSWCEYV